LDFGTGDFSAMGWFKSTDANAYLFSRLDDGNLVGDGWISVRIISSAVQFLVSDDQIATVDIATSTHATNGGNWHCFVARRVGPQIEIWIDGQLSATTILTNAVGSLSNTSAKTKIGERQWAGSVPLSGSIALLRISATAPTAEQIAKMYNDEKHLFSTNAKATLYGTSDAVTALAYDDDTELLHVGTSAGRSEFQGLNRVNNTTDAVSAAISASNGFIVEE
jgi:hypothetical protein